MKQCPRCGQRIEDPDSFCRSCGAPLSARTDSESRSPARWLVPLFAGGFLFLLLMVRNGPHETQGEKRARARISSSTVASHRPALTPAEQDRLWPPFKKSVHAPSVRPSPPTGVYTVASWHGNGIKQTEPFHIPSHQWRISWLTRPGSMGEGNFGIYIYKTDGELVTVAANVMGKSRDSSMMYGAGDYYLSIIATQPYAIVVEAVRQ